MVKFRCDVCNVYEYNEETGDDVIGASAGTTLKELPDSFRCPVCQADKNHLKELPKESNSDSIPKNLVREKDELEVHMVDIHEIALNGKTIIEPMRTKVPVIDWNDVLIIGAQLAKLPLNKEEFVSTKTIIGPNAKTPLEISMPIYVTHMSFGALSKEAKLSLVKGSACVGTTMCSGEGGILPESFEAANKYIFEYVPNEYSLEFLNKVDAVEIKIGQSTKPGMGGHLPGNKVTQEIAKIRGFPVGKDIISPSHFKDIKNKDDLKKKVTWLRAKTNGKPVGIKFAAGNIEEDLRVALYAKPDFITIDGRPGATGASGKFVKIATSIPTLFALYRTKSFFEQQKIKEVSLCITGGFRISADFAKALALGADAIAIGTSALMAIGCQQYRTCHTGKCPMGITTQDPKLRKRVNIEESARWLSHFLRISNEELKDFARLTGYNDVHKLSINDLRTVNSEISNNTKIKHI